jgi:serine/threonine-protein kinase
VAAQFISHYRIITKLGSGGMGEVYLAEDTRLRRKVALKLLSADLTKSEDRLRRFEQEAFAASALSHPNILVIHEIGSQHDVHYIATEYIEGETLRSQMARGTVPLREALDVAAQVASALAAAHSTGIVHRDIKPENIMLRPDGYVKVLDFGLAKLIETTPLSSDTEAPTIARVATDPGTVMGTVAYMAPEQARGQSVDARADIFSLGAVIYEMVAGRPPFDGESASDIIADILKTQPLPLARYSQEAPAELERIVTKALAKDKEERYQTAKDLLIDLKRLRQRQELEAELERSMSPETFASTAARVAVTTDASAAAERTTSSAEYLISEIRRHKRGALAAAGILALAISALAYFFYIRDEGKAIDSIAVLPLMNASDNPNAEYLSDGITESVINSLSQLPNLKVMSRNSVFRYKAREIEARAVARELGVQALLTGRVVQRGDDLSVSIELVDARDNTQIWGQKYTRKLADLFAVQEDIAREISSRLRQELTGDEYIAKRYTDNIRAYQSYMQGRAYIHRRTREDLLTAMRYCEKAIDEDSNYALAHCGLAEAYGYLGVLGYIEPIEGRRKAEEAARRALALDENLAEAHAALGRAYTGFAPYNFAAGDRELRRAIELSPSLAIGHQYLSLSLVRQGRYDEGIKAAEKARELDPLSSIIARTVAHGYYLKRDYARTIDILGRANELGPPFTSTWEIGAYIRTKAFDETLAQLEKAKRDRKDDPILVYGAGMVYAAQGKGSDALEVIKELEALSGTGLSHYIAKIYAVLNDKERAIVSLERGLATGAIGAFYRDEWVWDTIRDDPRFEDLIRRMHITP